MFQVSTALISRLFLAIAPIARLIVCTVQRGSKYKLNCCSFGCIRICSLFSGCSRGSFRTFWFLDMQPFNAKLHTTQPTFYHTAQPPHRTAHPLQPLPIYLHSHFTPLSKLSIRHICNHSTKQPRYTPPPYSHTYLVNPNCSFHLLAMRASRLFVLLALLFLSSSLVAARNAKRFKPGPYAAAVEEEYRLGAIRNALIPANQPQQVLTSLSGIEGNITVTWATFTDTGTSLQWGYKSGSLSNNDEGIKHNFVDPEGPHTVRVMHTAHMSDLKPHATVYYRVGDAAAKVWSDELQFVAPPSGLSSPVALIIYGDLGLLNAQSMDKVTAEVQSGEADMVLHVTTQRLTITATSTANLLTWHYNITTSFLSSSYGLR